MSGQVGAVNRVDAMGEVVGVFSSSGGGGGDDPSGSKITLGGGIDIIWLMGSKGGGSGLDSIPKVDPKFAMAFEASKGTLIRSNKLSYA